MSGGTILTPEGAFRQALEVLEPIERGRRRRPRCHMADRHRGKCGPPVQAHHVIPRRLLRALARDLGLPESVLISDARNGIFLCELHHTQIEKTKTVPLYRTDLPPRFTAFETQFELHGVFDRLYTEHRIRQSQRRGGDDDAAGVPTTPDGSNALNGAA